MFKEDKSKAPKEKKEETKGKVTKEATTVPSEAKKEEKKYSDRIKPTDKKSEETQPQSDKQEEQKGDDKASHIDPSKTGKSSKKKKVPEQPEKDYKMHKAKDGLNIEIPSDHMLDIPKKPLKPDSGKAGKKNSKTPKNSTGEDFNKTRKLPPNILDGLSDEDFPSDHKEDHSNISIGRIAKE
jgi:hypothetical protein